MSNLLSARDEPELEQTRYDVVLLGTGLTNTILAGALSKAGCSVLHVDARSEYGAHMASHNLAAFAEFVTTHAGASPAAAPTSSPSEDQLSQWRAQYKALDAEAQSDTLSFEPIVARDPFFGGSFEDYSLAHAKAQQETKEAQENEARIAAASAAAEAAAAAASAQPAEGAAPDAAVPEVAAAAPVVPVAAAAAPVVVKSPIMSQSRRFSIDLSPHLLFSRSPLIDLLVASGIHQYLEFKAADHAYFATGAAAKGAGSASASSGATTASSAPALSLLPLSKSSIFQSSSLSMLEKRQLMKFLHLTLGDDYHAPTVGQAQEDRWRPQSAEVEVDTKVTVAPQQARHPALSEEQASQPFSAFLALQKLSPQLTQMVLYAVALLDENVGAPAPSIAITAAEGMDRLRSYLASVGRYGPGAFLYPNYGLSELPQAFVRLSAVNRGVYILRFQPVAVVYANAAEQGGAKKLYKGVLTAGGQLLSSAALVAESDYNSAEPSSEQGTHELFYARAVLITDGPLAAAGSTALAPSSFFSFAPSAGAADESPVYGLQFSSEVSAAPKGYCVVHLYAVSSTLEGSQRNAQRLKTLALSLTQQLGSTESSSSDKPNLLAMGAYQQRVVRPIIAATPWNGAANKVEDEAEKEDAAAASSAAAPVTETAAPTAVTAPETSTTAPADAAASSSSDAPSSAASSVAAAPSPCRPVSQPLYSFAPSASVALALDESLYDAQSLFARLCPSADFRRAMRTQPQETHDDEMALLSQIAQQQTAEGDDEGDHADGQEAATTTTAMTEAGAAAREAAIEAAPDAAAPAADAVVPVDPSAASTAAAAPAS